MAPLGSRRAFGTPVGSRQDRGLGGANGPRGERPILIFFGIASGATGGLKVALKWAPARDWVACLYK